MGPKQSTPHHRESLPGLAVGPAHPPRHSADSPQSRPGEKEAPRAGVPQVALLGSQPVGGPLTWPLRSQRQAASPFCFQNHPAPRGSWAGRLLGGEGYAHLSSKKQTRAGSWSRARLTPHPQNSPERLSVGKRPAEHHAESHRETSLGNEENKHGHTWQPGQTSGRKVAQRQPDTQGQVAP